jgi:nanoRNase/pAp phosphatase (c-di-AMP/oligoRNAs hydrolase)
VDYDLLVVSDCAGIDRIGSVAGRHPELFARLPRVVLDHHASNGETGDADWVDATAAATCEMTALLARRLGVPFEDGDGALAAQLMAGIVMDTATFAHPNATPRTLAVSAALVEAGAPLSDISRRLYRSKPEAQLRLFGRRPGSGRDRGGGPDHPLLAVRRGLRRDRRDPGPFRGDHRPARTGRRGRRRDRVSRSRARPPPG